MTDFRDILRGLVMPPALPPMSLIGGSGQPPPSPTAFSDLARQLAGGMAPSSGRRTPLSVALHLPPPPRDQAPGGGEVGPMEPGVPPAPIGDVLDELARGGVPIVPGRDSRIPPDGVMGDNPGAPDSGVNDQVYNGPAPVTRPIVLNPFDPNTGARIGSDPVTHPDGSQSITYPIPDHLPPGVPVDPTYTVPPGATITTNSPILNPGTTVGDFLGGPPAPSSPSAGDFLTNPIGAAGDLLGGLFGDSTGWSDFAAPGQPGAQATDYAGVPNPWTSNPRSGLLDFVDPYDPWGEYGGDPGDYMRRELERLRRNGGIDNLPTGAIRNG